MFLNGITHAYLLQETATSIERCCVRGRTELETLLGTKTNRFRRLQNQKLRDLRRAQIRLHEFHAVTTFVATMRQTNYHYSSEWKTRSKRSTRRPRRRQERNSETYLGETGCRYLLEMNGTNQNRVQTCVLTLAALGIRALVPQLLT